MAVWHGTRHEDTLAGSAELASGELQNTEEAYEGMLGVLQPSH